MLTQTDKALDLAERLGGEREGEFAPSGVPISEIAREYGTPFYLYHGETIVERVRRVREALGTEVSYSVKANPSLGVCQLIAREREAGAEVASSGELAVARAAGFEPEDIVFAGPGKTDDELRRVVEEGIFADNVESLGEIDRLARIAGEMGRKIGVGLRINPAAQLMGSQMRMGGTVGQFGMDQAELDEAVAKTLSHPELILRGVHVYTATQVFEVEPLLEHCRNIFEIALQTASYAGRPLEMIDFGGGFGVPYFEKMSEFDLASFGEGFRELLKTYRADSRLEGCRFLFELGRYLVADAGVYVTRRSGVPEEGVAIAGPCCTPLDMFGSNISLAEPEVGDLIGVFYSGAYGFSASNLGFLSHPAPAEVLLWRGEAHQLRAGGKPEDVLDGQEALKG